MSNTNKKRSKQAVTRSTAEINSSTTTKFDYGASWEPFRGCRFGCKYCAGNNNSVEDANHCVKCKAFAPHYHPEVLNLIPNDTVISVCGSSDLSFCDYNYFQHMLFKLRQHQRRHPKTCYLFQSKQPYFFGIFINELPPNTILATTLETNRDEDYGEISAAPTPSERYRQFLNLDFPQKFLMLDPLMDFDVHVFAEWIIRINPQLVYVGSNRHPSKLLLPDPFSDKTNALFRTIECAGIKIYYSETYIFKEDSCSP